MSVTVDSTLTKVNGVPSGLTPLYIQNLPLLPPFSGTVDVAIWGDSDKAIGLAGTSNHGPGIVGISATPYSGILGINQGDGAAVYAETSTIFLQ